MHLNSHNFRICPLPKKKVCINNIFSKCQVSDFSRPPPETQRFYEDSDIRDEREMIENMDKYERRAYSLILDNISKHYGKLKAVDRVSLCLSK